MSMKLSVAFQEELSKNLPGYKAQIKMAPEGRPQIETFTKKRNAAVAIIILEETISGEKEIILIKRPEYEGPHSGQISFPGGKQEAKDNNLINTAIRECYEELGILLTSDRLAGALTPLYIPISEYMVYPFVFFNDLDPLFKINPDEVSYVIRSPLSELLKEEKIKKINRAFKGHDYLIPYFDIQNEFVWGATAMILSEFVEVLRSIKNKNPGVI